MDVSPLYQTVAGVHRYITSILTELEATGKVSVHRYALPGRSRLSSLARDVAWYLGVLPRNARRDCVEQHRELLDQPRRRGPARSRVF